MITATTVIYFYLTPTMTAITHEPPCTWEEFVAVNSDGMTADELAEIKSALEGCGVYRGGGGAAAEYELHLTPPDKPCH